VVAAAYDIPAIGDSLEVEVEKGRSKVEVDANPPALVDRPAEVTALPSCV
jgi:hypothetical protein